jgi:hypothetical protein
MISAQGSLGAGHELLTAFQDADAAVELSMVTRVSA